MSVVAGKGTACIILFIKWMFLSPLFCWHVGDWVRKVGFDCCGCGRYDRHGGVCLSDLETLILLFPWCVLMRPKKGSRLDGIRVIVMKQLKQTFW